jgi:hypothetical protein
VEDEVSVAEEVSMAVVAMLTRDEVEKVRAGCDIGVSMLEYVMCFGAPRDVPP